MLVTDDRVDIDIEIDKNRVCHYTGYDADYKLSARISSLIDDYAEHAHHLINPSYTYIIRDVEWARGSISFVEDSIIFKSRVIGRLLENCSQVAIFLVTIGEYLEETAHRLAKDGRMLQATVLDAIGSDAVEKLMDFVQDRISEAANTEGLVTSQRFSPGYCDWNIGQQRMLFWALKGNTLGIHLTGDCLMIPQKSISGIIGIGPSIDNVEDYNPCMTCKKQDCSGRREALKI
jgi:hypothetical protein